MTQTDETNRSILGRPVGRRAVLGGVAASLVTSPTTVRAMGRRLDLDPGRGTFHSAGIRGVSVRYWRPEEFSENGPILFVLPGIDRDAQSYRDVWIPYARREKALLLVPHFSLRDYPGSRGYNLGNMFDSGGVPTPAADWTFAKIEQLFDLVRDAIGGAQTHYRIYGHSAGAQFVHRLVLFMPTARIARAISANAGWYTFPDYGTRFPYGLGGTRLTDVELAMAFAQDYSILLGMLDTEESHPTLRTTREAERQGPNRYARGVAFFEAARTKAGELGVPFKWSLATVPGATHSNAEMADAAAHALLGVSG